MERLICCSCRFHGCSGEYAQTKPGWALDPVVDSRQRAFGNWKRGIMVTEPNMEAADCRGIRVLRDAAGSPGWPAFVQ